MQRLRYIAMIGCLLLSTLSAKEANQIDLKDVYKTMQQILEEHVDQKTINSKILKSAYASYIDQFDPLRLYLLSSEVKPYLNPSDQEIAKAISDYQNQNLDSFVQLNQLIVSSIKRARKIRKQFEQESDQTVNPNRSLNFADTLQELEKKNRQDFQLYIQKNAKTPRQEVLKHYNQAKMQEEGPYIGEDENGKPLPEANQMNFLAMHILKALTSSLDAHSKFLNTTEAFDMRVRLEKEYQGLGIGLKQTNDGFIITKLLEGGPAAKSGKISVNDQIIAIDARPVENEPLNQVLEWLHDPQNPVINLKIKRDNDTFNVELMKANIYVDEGRVETSFIPFKEGIIGHIILHSFYRSDTFSSEKDVRAAIKKLNQEGKLLGLILDLRDNTGGFLTEGVKVASLFITSGVIVTSKFSSGGEHIYRDLDGQAAFTGPLVILTSKETASAAEIVSQALQDYGVALIVGDERTYGKGTIQTQTATDSNSSTPYFKVTVGKYFTVSGKTPQLKGVKADIVVPSLLAHARLGEQFLDNPEPGGHIAPSYDDNLEDIDYTKRSWYVKYYKKHLQKQEKEWRTMLPELKSRSEERIANNRAYQTLLKKLNKLPDDLLIAPILKNPDQDLQLQEAYKIVEDMILLEKPLQ